MRTLSLCLLGLLISGCVTTRIRPPKVEGPPGTIPLEALSANDGLAWDLYVGGEKVCTTPCTGFAQPSRAIALYANGEQVLVPQGLLDYKHLGPLRIRAVASDDGLFTAGIVFTSLGGMTLITGGSLALAGAVGERTDLRGAGTITAMAGAAVTAAGLMLMFNAFPHAEIYAFDGERPVRIFFAPTMVAADF